MFSQQELQEIKEYIKNTPKDTDIYIGTDSHKGRKNKVTRYATVVVIHPSKRNGAKIFGTITTEKDVQEKKNRPFNRMMNEAFKSTELYLELADTIQERKCELHLDINPDEVHGSHVAHQSAIGYVKGVAGLTPVVKPSDRSFAASVCADKWVKQ